MHTCMKYVPVLQIKDWATRILDCNPPPEFVPNGGTIPDWSHLTLNYKEFITMASEPKRLGACQGLPKFAADYVYK
jgi:hypothetical protein